MKQKITSAVSEVFGFDGNIVFQKTRKQEIVLARQMCFYFLRKEMGWSLHKIRDLLGFHHATVHHGIKSVESEIDVYKDTKSLYISFKLAMRVGEVSEKELIQDFIHRNNNRLSERLKSCLKDLLEENYQTV